MLMVSAVLPLSDIDDYEFVNLYANNVNLINALPFSVISDDELVEVFAYDTVAAGYDHLYFNPYELFDKHSINVNPDSHLNGDILYKRQLCNYYDVSQYMELCSSYVQCGVSVIALNIRSIPKNLEEFLLEFDVVKLGVDVLAFTETRLSQNIEPMYKIPNYNMFTNSRSTAGGGVAIYVSNEFTCNVVEELTILLPDFEIITILASKQGDQYLFCNMYRPPDANVHTFNSYIGETLLPATLAYSRAKCIVVGDFNIDLLRLSERQHANEYLTTMFSYGYMPQILRPTRVTARSATLIDNIWLNDESLLVSSGVVKSVISDHFPVFVRVLGLESENRNGYIHYSKRIINNTCKENFTSAISSVNFDDILSSYNVNNIYNILVQRLQYIFNSCFPIVNKKKKKLDVHKLYIDDEI